MRVRRKVSGRAEERPAAYLGRLGERLAARFLRRQGYRILERNFRSKFGEVDVVALEGEVLCFVEVRTRSGRPYAPIEETVTARKQQRVRRAAADFMRRNSWIDIDLRCDVVCVEVEEGARKPRISLLRGAF